MKAIDAELKALRLLHRNWGKRPENQRRGDLEMPQWTIAALKDTGFTVSYPPNKEIDDEECTR